MSIVSEIRVPLPEECGSELDRYRHLGEMSDRLGDNLRDSLGAEFVVRSDPRSIAFGGQWSRETRVYRDGELRATFGVNYDSLMSPQDFQLSCSIPSQVALPSAHAMAASLALASGATALAGPLAGLLAGGTTLLATTLANRGNRGDRNWFSGKTLVGDQALHAFDLRTSILRQPLAS